MTGRERVAVWDRDERAGVVRPSFTDERLDDRSQAVGSEHRDRGQHEHDRVATPEREREREHEPDEPMRAELRQPDEDLVQRMPAVVDDPPLRVFVPAGQTGAIVFV